jgi:hypothetical protein
VSVLRLSLAHVRYRIDPSSLVRGRSWLAFSSIGSCAATVALSSFLLIGTVAMAVTLRREVGRSGEDFVVVEQALNLEACRISDVECDGQSRTASTADFLALASLIGNRDFALLGSWRAPLHVAGGRPVVSVVGVQGAWLSLEPVTIEEGRSHTLVEERRGARSLLVGRKLLDSLFNGIAPRAVVLNGAQFDVVGVVSSGPTARVDMNRAVVVPFHAATRLRSSFAPTLFLVANAWRDDADRANIFDALGSLLRRRRFLRHAFSVTNSSQLLGDVAKLESTLERGSRIFGVGLSLVALTSSFALLASIALSSRRAIGVCRSLGAPRLAVVFEGGALGACVGLLGAVLGCVLAILIASWAGLLSELAFGEVALALFRGALPVVVSCSVVGSIIFSRASRETISSLIA